MVDTPFFRQVFKFEIGLVAENQILFFQRWHLEQLISGFVELLFLHHLFVSLASVRVVHVLADSVGDKHIDLRVAIEVTKLD